MCLIIRFYLQRENKRRVQLLTQSATESDEEGEAIDLGSEILKISERDLDKTDREDLRFIYPL